MEGDTHGGGRRGLEFGLNLHYVNYEWLLRWHSKQFRTKQGDKKLKTETFCVAYSNQWMGGVHCVHWSKKLFPLFVSF